MHGRQKKERCKKERKGGRVESTNKSSGETMLLKVANCPALLLPGTAGWAREPVFHSLELINDPRREKRTYEALDALVKALYRYGCLRSKRCRVLARGIILLRTSVRYITGESMATHGAYLTVLLRSELF